MNKENLLRLSNILWDKSRELYGEIYENEDSFKDIMDYRQLHSKIVADLAVNMFDKYFLKLLGTADPAYRPSLYFACLIHDVRKLNKKHNLAGARFFLENQGLLTSSLYDLQLVFCIVNYHSADKKGKDLEYMNEIGNLSDDIKLLLLFTRLSDKLSKLVLKSHYKEISPEEVDMVLKKINNNSKELLNFNDGISEILKEIENNFKYKYCI